MLQRPKFSETDEDILQIQKEFLQNKIKPAANLIKNEGKTYVDAI